MAQARKKNDPTVQERLRVMAAELRGLVYGEQGCPEWGTKFAQIEADGMSVGLELARLMMEQAAQQQADEMPNEALQFEGDTVERAGTDKRPLATEAGVVEWNEPLGYLKKGRRSFSPSVESVGDRCR